MSKPRTSEHRLESVRELAEGKEQQAARQLAEIQTLIRTQQTELQQLEHYQQDYSRQLLDKGKRGHNAHLLYQHSQFICQVHDLCAARRLQIMDLERRSARARKDWLHLRSRHQAIKKIIQRDHQAQQQKQRQHEQDQMDELAQRASRATTALQKG